MSETTVTISPIMTKRALETTRGIQSPCILQSSKRRRTESFLRRKAIYEEVVRSCSFIHQELAVLTAEDDDDSRTTDQRRVHPDRIASLSSSVKNIRKFLSQYEQRFRSTCQELNAEADDAINLSEGFDGLSRAIDMDPAAHQSNDSCMLPMLHAGPETTAEIKRLISQFAGVASSEQLDDMRQLKQQLSQS
jgi:hypothetical protein